jgi:hypothetical protein
MKKVNVGDEVVVKEKSFQHLTFGKVYKVVHSDLEYFHVVNDNGKTSGHEHHKFDVYFEVLKLESKDEAPKHYDNSNGSLYLFADKQGLNSYEFEVIKRIVRCRKKKEFISDIKKTIFVLELYLKEQGENYKGEEEILN